MGADPSNATLSLCVCGPEDGVLREQPLASPARESPVDLCLRSLPGASAVWLRLRDAAGKPVAAAEIEVNRSGETISVRLHRREDGTIAVESRNRHVWALPARDEVLPPLAPPGGIGMDIALVIDGTMRAPLAEKADPPPAPPLLLESDVWRVVSERVVDLVRTIACGAGGVEGAPDARATVLAFGDAPAPAGISAADLKGSYLLFPRDRGERVFRGEVAQSFPHALGAIRGTSGCDWVDALGDALVACEDLPWRADARKLVLVLGDSPGYSIEWPPPSPFADIRARVHDVDGAAMRLFRQGIEIVTIHSDLRDVTQWSTEGARELVEHVAQQYQRIASEPDYALLLSTLDAEAAARLVLSRRDPRGRGASAPIWAPAGVASARRAHGRSVAA